MDPTLTLAAHISRKSAASARLEPALAIAWSRDEAERVGEVAVIPMGASTLGRLDPSPTDEVQRLTFARHRPGRIDATGPLKSPHVSREQLRFERSADGLVVTNLGKSPLLVGGRTVTEAHLTRASVGSGEVVEVADRLLLLLVWRPVPMPDVAAGIDLAFHAFAGPDALGMVGETPAVWALRERIAFIAARGTHVLVQGPSGTGKEHVAKALHDLSPRRRRAWVSRNAATIPDTLVDAELFGNLKDYPNPGTPDRKGLIGEADGGTLLLDEFGELPAAMQARLLRVLDDGEYTRLGEAKPRRSDLRLVAATNRALEDLKHDVLARFKLRLEVPGLDERREDIPLLAHALLRVIARNDPLIARRFFERGDTTGAPKLDIGFVRMLVQATYTTHIRELEALLWLSLQQSRGDVLEAPVRPKDSAGKAPANEGIDPSSLDPEAIQACLDRHDGEQEPVWRELGLSSRHALGRLVKKHGLKVKGRA